MAELLREVFDLEKVILGTGFTVLRLLRPVLLSLPGRASCPTVGSLAGNEIGRRGAVSRVCSIIKETTLHSRWLRGRK